MFQEYFKILSVILLPYICFGQLFGQVWTSEIKPNDSSIKKVGSWTHMIDKGSFSKTNTSYLEYMATCFQIDIYTELNPAHSYFIIEYKDKKDTVNIKGELMPNFLAYSVTNESIQDTIKIKISGPAYGYVINSFVKYVDSDPFHKPIYKDSIIVKDSILYNYELRDTTIYRIEEKDSIHWNISEQDSIQWNITEKDSIKWNVVTKDSLIYKIDSAIICINEGDLSLEGIQIEVDLTKQNRLIIITISISIVILILIVVCILIFKRNDANTTE